MFRIKCSKADALFSEFIRERADWTCERCHVGYEPPTTSLQCSHFWGRGNKSVRFDPENAAALCFKCHQTFTANPEDHREWFYKRLGKAKYEALRCRALMPKKVDEWAICVGLTLDLAKLKEEKAKRVFGGRAA